MLQTIRIQTQFQRTTRRTTRRISRSLKPFIKKAPSPKLIFPVPQLQLPVVSDLATTERSWHNNWHCAPSLFSIDQVPNIDMLDSLSCTSHTVETIPEVALPLDRSVPQLVDCPTISPSETQWRPRERRLSLLSAEHQAQHKTLSTMTFPTSLPRQV